MAGLMEAEAAYFYPNRAQSERLVMFNMSWPMLMGTLQRWTGTFRNLRSCWADRSDPKYIGFVAHCSESETYRFSAWLLAAPKAEVENLTVTN